MSERFYIRLPKTVIRSSWAWVSDNVPVSSLPASKAVSRSLQALPEVRRRLQRRYHVVREARAARAESKGSKHGEQMPLGEIGTMAQLAVRHELENRYVALVERADPSLRDAPELAREFAAQLADFSASWGKHYPDRPEQIRLAKSKLFVWIDQHSQVDSVPAMNRNGREVR